MKKKIVIVDDDEKYISMLELIFLTREEELVDIEVVTGEYFNEYFSQSRNINCLIIDEKYYNGLIEKQRIELIFCLTCVQEKEKQNTIREECIYKYSSVKEIFHKIIGKMGLPTDARSVSSGRNGEKSRVIMVYSPVGGVGKTSIALALCGQLAKLNKSVIYLNFDDIQTFQWYINKDSYIENGFERQLHTKKENLIDSLQDAVWHMDFDVLKPFKGTKEAYGLEVDHYEYFIDKLKKSRVYDFVVVDGGSTVGKMNSALMMKCDKIVMVLNQTAYLNYSIRNFLNNIRVSEKEKIIYICNRYNQFRENSICFSVVEYIPEIEEKNGLYVENWIDLGAMKETALMLA